LSILIFLCLSLNCQSIGVERILETNTGYNDVNSPHDGHVPISNSPKLAVSVDLDYNFTTRSAKRTVNMLISLYKSRSMLSSGCLGFDSFPVAQHSAKIQSTGDWANYTNFVSGGAYLNLSLWLDYAHWNLSAEAILGSNCWTSGVSFYRTGLWGVLGLGFDGDSIRNFIGKKPEFAILLEQDGAKGELSFVIDAEKTKNPPNISLVTDANWHVKNVKRIGFSSSVINQKSYAMDGDFTLIFDINSDAIGLPLTIFTSMMKIIGKFEGIKSCTSDLYRPSCEISSTKISDFPTVRIIAGKSLISLGPESYILNANVSSETKVKHVVFNIKGLDRDVLGKNFVIPEYENTIILDSQMMKNYYTVFSGNSAEKTGVINLYEVKRNYEEAEDAFFTTGFVIKTLIGLVVVIVLLTAIRSYIRKRANSAEEITYQDPVAISLVKRRTRLSTKNRKSTKSRKSTKGRKSTQS